MTDTYESEPAMYVVSMDAILKKLGVEAKPVIAEAHNIVVGGGTP